MPTKAKPARRPKKSPLEQEVSRALSKLNHAVDGPSSIEMLQLASMQVIQHKLSEIAQLIDAFGLPVVGHAALPAISVPAPASPSNRAPTRTIEDVRREVEEADRAAGTPAAAIPGKVCEICGLPGAYKTSRGAIYCSNHRQMGITDDQQDKLQSMLRMGFGGGKAGSEEVIRVPT